ncbi:MAG: helix-turn-helix transcriptional regulator [Spirochaetales bacterium]|nr:helix-turn-helix transcriptional regulator [Spirochaetales bacterium]
MDINSIDEITQQEQKVALKIQQERTFRKMSQMDLALEAGISQGYLAMVESHQKIPTITTIFKIAKALGIAPAALFESTDMDKQQIKNQIIDLIQSKL